MKNPVLEKFFTYDINKNSSKCNVVGCTKYISGKHASNLEKHIFALHKNECKDLTEAKLSKSGARIDNVQLHDKAMVSND
ncbi:zinc finger BED domain-containing protein RICESLEEPER 1-like isoform X1 [Aphis craccivora]|uniref:Zinc finger BED domain-containing protein RICESLEEPER 1-like isoform X1 n=1 Tax=Aphis craccivora TaxID=307492 RepID=A0A6G0W1B2_APHCR|nr:zinc finger BED domain-containing protein RICESLEEPER 1-like isoform X1 [Aphis craccivora]